MATRAERAKQLRKAARFVAGRCAEGAEGDGPWEHRWECPRGYRVAHTDTKADCNICTANELLDLAAQSTDTPGDAP